MKYGKEVRLKLTAAWQWLDLVCWVRPEEGGTGLPLATTLKPVERSTACPEVPRGRRTGRMHRFVLLETSLTRGHASGPYIGSPLPAHCLAGFNA